MTMRQSPQVLGARHLHAARLMDLVWWGLAVAIVLGVAVPTVVGIVESFANLYGWARSNGVDDPLLALAWPAMIDTFIIAGEAGALVGAIDRWAWHQRVLPWSMVGLGLGASLAFNVANETELAAKATAGAAPVAAFLGLMAASQFVKRTVAAALDAEQGHSVNPLARHSTPTKLDSDASSAAPVEDDTGRKPDQAGTAASANTRVRLQPLELVARSPRGGSEAGRNETSSSQEATEGNNEEQQTARQAAASTVPAAAEPTEPATHHDTAPDSTGTAAAGQVETATADAGELPAPSRENTAPTSTAPDTQRDVPVAPEDEAAKAPARTGTANGTATATVAPSSDELTPRAESETPATNTTTPPREEATSTASEPAEPATHHDTAAGVNDTTTAGPAPEVNAGATGPIGTDLEWEALTLLAAEPEITGAELGRRLGRSASTGERLMAKLIGESISAQ